MATKTVAETLRIKPHTTVWTTQPDFLDRVGTLPDGVTQVDAIDQADTAILVVGSEASARETLDSLKDHLDSPRILWVAIPRDTTSEIDRETLEEILEAYRRRPVSRQVVIDDTWAAMRFGKMKPGEQPLSAAARRAAADAPSDLPVELSGPARRALAGAVIVSLADLAQWSEKDVLGLHGLGPKTIGPLREALAEAGLSFADRDD